MQTGVDREAGVGLPRRLARPTNVVSIDPLSTLARFFQISRVSLGSLELHELTCVRFGGQRAAKAESKKSLTAEAVSCKTECSSSDPIHHWWKVVEGPLRDCD